MIYLASPYSHHDPAIRQQRFEETCCCTARLLGMGTVVFSPVIHGHPLVHHGLPSDWSFWEPIDHEFLLRCDELLVLMLTGWNESVGVAEEIRLAHALGKPVHYLPPKEIPPCP